MPEYKRGRWEPVPNPPYEELVLKQDVFQIWPTGEMFTEYEKYVERLYAYKQREWSCKYTGKGQLTFSEAYASEEKVKKTLDQMPEAWKGPLLAFVQHSVQSLDSIAAAFLEYIKTTFIPGEIIKLDFDGRRLSGKIISSSEASAGERSYRVEIFQDEACEELVGEANIIGANSFIRDRQLMNRAMVKKYIRSVAVRKASNLPWFLPDELAVQYGVSIELPPGLSEDMRPAAGEGSGDSSKRKKSTPEHIEGQTSIADFFMLADDGSGAAAAAAAEPFQTQFEFPCDDAMVPQELIDPDLKRPDLVPVDYFVKSSADLNRSITLWSFSQTFANLLALSPFAYDDWEEAVCSMDPGAVDSVLVEETYLALLSSLMKDRRSLSKAQYAEKLKTAIMSFDVSSYKTAPMPLADDVEPQPEATGHGSSADGEVLEAVELELGASDADYEETFVKRPKRAPVSATPSQPSIDLRRHRWYETKATDNWLFVLASFFLEALDMANQFLLESLDETDESSEEDSAKEDNKEEPVDAGDGGQAEDSVSIVSAATGDSMPISSGKPSPSPVVEPSQSLQAFHDHFSELLDRLTEFGSKGLLAAYTKLSVTERLGLLDFLVHTHCDRETYRVHVEQAMDRQADLRRDRRELETGLPELVSQVQALEADRDENLVRQSELTERLDADKEAKAGAESSEIELSDDEGEGEEGEDEDETEPEPVKETAEVVLLSDSERKELLNERTLLRREMKQVDAQLRSLRTQETRLSTQIARAVHDLRAASSYRTSSLGQDRDGRTYWWFGDFNPPMPRILVQDGAGAWIGCYESTEELDQLMAWLNPLGIREAKLTAAIMEVEADLRSELKPRDLPDHLKKPVEAAEKEEGDDDEEEDDEVAPIQAGKRARGRPKGSKNKGVLAQMKPGERPFQRYRNKL